MTLLSLALLRHPRNERKRERKLVKKGVFCVFNKGKSIQTLILNEKGNVSRKCALGPSNTGYGLKMVRFKDKTISNDENYPLLRI